MITTLWCPRRSPNIVRHAIHLLCDRPASTTFIRVLLRDLHADLSRIPPLRFGDGQPRVRNRGETTCDCSLCRQKNADDHERALTVERRGVSCRSRVELSSGPNISSAPLQRRQRATPDHSPSRVLSVGSSSSVPVRATEDASMSAVDRNARCQWPGPREAGWHRTCSKTVPQTKTSKTMPQTKTPPRFPEAAFRILTSKEEDFLSFAGLAATYSPRA